MPLTNSPIYLSPFLVRVHAFLGNIINKMNYMINENKKNVQLIRNDISSLYNKLNKRFDELNINIYNYIY